MRHDSAGNARHKCVVTFVHGNTVYYSPLTEPSKRLNSDGRVLTRIDVSQHEATEVNLEKDIDARHFCFFLHGNQLFLDHHICLL